MKLKNVISPVFILICVASATAQDAAVVQPTEINSSRQPQVRNNDAKVKELAALREKTVSLLKATGREASSLNLPENRIRYLTDAAEMLWQDDEKTARNFFANAMNDYRDLLQSLETAHQQSVNGEGEEDFMGGMFGGGRNNSRRIYQMQNIRRHLLTTLAKYDAQTAYDFFRETQRENLKEYSSGDSTLESQLAALVAKNDPSRALEVGLQKLSKNEFEGLNELTMNLYEKDAAKGAKLASEIVRKLRGETSSEPYLVLQTASSLFQSAVEIADKKQSDKPRLLEDTALQELAETVIRNIGVYRKRYNYVGIESYSSIKDSLKKYAPASFAKLERDIEAAKAKAEAAAKSQDNYDEEQAMQPKVVAVESPTAVTSAGNGSGTGVVSTAATTAASSRDAQAEALTRLMKAATTGEEKLSVDEVRKTLSQIRSRPQRLMALTQIAKSFAERGDKETARDLLKDTAEFQNTQPRKAPEMMQNLMLADALSGVEPDRAFTLLEYTLFEINGVATSFHRIGEFMDAKEIADGNEFNMSGFPREMLQVGSTGGLGLQKMLFNLASADFDRTAALADKLERPELRLEARMLIIRSLLPRKDAEILTGTGVK